MHIIHTNEKLNKHKPTAKGKKMTHQSPEETNYLARKVLALLDGLSVTQVRDVLDEAERLTNAYAMHVCSTTSFQSAVAAPRLGGD